MSEEEKVTAEEEMDEHQPEEASEEAAAEEASEEAAAEEAKEEAPAGEVQADTVDYHDKWLRVTAEYQNYRTRTIKEKEEIYQNAIAKFVEGLMEVIDNF